jgi:hypothetical protein
MFVAKKRNGGFFNSYEEMKAAFQQSPYSILLDELQAFGKKRATVNQLTVGRYEVRGEAYTNRGREGAWWCWLVVQERATKKGLVRKYKLYSGQGRVSRRGATTLSLREELI